MNLYIKLENGQPINHPMFEDNILQCYPDIDLNNTELFAPFNRLEIPSRSDLPVGIFQVLETRYVLSNDGISYEDQYYTRDMDADEISYTTNVKIDTLKNGVSSLKSMVLVDIDTASEIDKPVWQAFYDELDAITDSEIETDPFSFNLPRIPKKDTNGTWVSLQSSGSAPNVIG